MKKGRKRGREREAGGWRWQRISAWRLPLEQALSGREVVNRIGAKSKGNTEEKKTEAEESRSKCLKYPTSGGVEVVLQVGRF